MRDQFLQDVLANENNRAILDRWSELNLPDSWLVAGCLFQTVWNLCSGLPPESQIKDYDLFYFDDSDLSPEAEQFVQAYVDELFADRSVVVEAKNQARVHLWYQEHFGHQYQRLTCTTDGIDRFLIPSTCVGVRPTPGGYEIYAPNGLELVYKGVLSPNPLVDHRELFLAKSRSYRERWPWLQESFESIGAWGCASAPNTFSKRRPIASRQTGGER